MKRMVWILAVLLTACTQEAPVTTELTEMTEPQTEETPQETEPATETEVGTETDETTTEPIETEQDRSDVTPELSVDVLATGLSHPWDLTEIAPDVFLFTERRGVISRLEVGEVSIVAELPAVEAQGEGGLTGILADVDFSENRHVYAAYNTTKNGSPEVVITRFVLTEAYELTEATDIVTGIPANASGRHSGTRMRMDADGVLWIGTGDAASADNPQNPESLGGKILRITRDGEGVEGNQEAPFDPRIFSYGHRNVQGIELLDPPQEGFYGYTSEHGPAHDDEINLLVPGNFGWDPNPPYDESVSMTDTDAFPDAVEALWSSGTPTVAASDLTILTGDDWGRYEGWLAMATLKDQKLMLTDPQAPENPEIFFEGEYGRLRAALLGTDGALYLSTDNGQDDQILRVRPLR